MSSERRRRVSIVWLPPCLLSNPTRAGPNPTSPVDPAPTFPPPCPHPTMRVTMSDKRLGVLGGMGPLASAQFMLRLTLLTPAERDQDHIPAVLWSDPRVPDRTAAMQGAGEDPLPWLLRGIAALRQAGCGAIAIPCNTAHGWYDPMQQ